MDDDTEDLVIKLCARIGMIMEDASVVALTIRGRDQTSRLAAVAELDGAARRIGALVEAAKSLLG